MGPSPVQKIVLTELLLYGDNSPVNVAKGHDVHHKSVSRTLSELEDDGLVENKGNGVYRLTKKGESAAQEYLHRLLKRDLE